MNYNKNLKFTMVKSTGFQGLEPKFYFKFRVVLIFDDLKALNKRHNIPKLHITKL
jgi:hypothetical protein